MIVVPSGTQFHKDKSERQIEEKTEKEEQEEQKQKEKEDQEKEEKPDQGSFKKEMMKKESKKERKVKEEEEDQEGMEHENEILSETPTKGLKYFSCLCVLNFLLFADFFNPLESNWKKHILPWQQVVSTTLHSFCRRYCFL